MSIGPPYIYALPAPRRPPSAEEGPGGIVWHTEALTGLAFAFQLDPKLWRAVIIGIHHDEDTMLFVELIDLGGKSVSINWAGEDPCDVYEDA